MRPLTCAAARRRLQAFHDGELPVAEQIAVAAHLDLCGVCTDALADMQALSSLLRAAVSSRRGLTADDAASFRSAVVSRAKAEREQSLAARVRSMFDDLHLVYAGFGAAVATVVCVVIMSGMMRFASSERSDSLAAMVAFLATPGSSADAIAMDAASHARWTARFQAANESAQQDAVFALANVLTREGRIADFERLRGRGRKSSPEQVKAIEELLDAVTRAQLEGDAPVTPSSIVGLVTHTTVRATASATRALDFVLPAKKRAAKTLSLSVVV